MTNVRRLRFAALAVIAALGASPRSISCCVPSGPRRLLAWSAPPRLPIAPEIGGQLAAIRVRKGERVKAGDVLAELAAPELTAALAQARAERAVAIASRDHVYAGVRDEQIAVLAAEIRKANSRLTYAQAQHDRVATLAQEQFAAQQSLDQANADIATGHADVAAAEANYAAAKNGPTNEERAIADAQVLAATAAVEVLEHRLEKTILRAPADGIVQVIVAEVGEAVRAGQPVVTIEEVAKRWLSFNVREDRLQGTSVGDQGECACPGCEQANFGTCYGAVTARTVRHLAGRARGGRSRPQYGAHAGRSRRRACKARARDDGVA